MGRGNWAEDGDENTFSNKSLVFPSPHPPLPSSKGDVKSERKYLLAELGNPDQNLALSSLVLVCNK